MIRAFMIISFKEIIAVFLIKVNDLNNSFVAG